jgi:hypothetical protein
MFFNLLVANLTKNSFVFEYVVGRGGFGKVGIKLTVERYGK